MSGGKIKKKNIKQNEFMYKKEDIPIAVEEVKLGKPLRQIAAKYKIPPATLHNKINNVSSINAKKSPQTILTAEEEQQLVDWILYSEERGFPVTQEQLLNSVRWLVLDLKKETPFTKDKPGRHWYEAFYRRHPELSKRKPQNLSYSRASVTEEGLRSWFAEVKKYLEDNNLLNIDENRIFNGDESGFKLFPDTDKVIVRKGRKTVHKVVGSNDKEQITSLFLYNAAGDKAPPLVIFSYQRMPANIASNFPKGWSIGKTENGWMTSKSFFEYIVNVFYPWLIQQNIEFPVILYMDGHSSHFTLPLSTFCREKNIILIALFPNSTHVIQPLDRTFFRPLKKAWG
ncbi:uncharacterized protein [Linepithema humile]|uniref:uncharacterized protein n=1 Tax=Linepithema humile TaxID=83485 RepID=UPI00351E150C